MKFFKIGIIILGAFLLLLVIGGGIFMATFDANQYRTLISEQVKQQTGRDFTLGDIKPSIFPWLGIELQQVSLSNADGFKAQKMMSMQRLDVRVELIPLLQQKIHIDTLSVHGLELYLEKNKQGRSNWDDILEKQAASPAATTQNAPVDNNVRQSSADDLLANIVINGVELKAAKISWNDASTGQQLTLKNINLITGALRAGEALPLTFSSVVQIQEPAARIAAQLKTRLEFNVDSRQVKLADLMLTLDAKFDESQIELQFNSELEMNLKDQKFDLRDYAIKVNAQGKAIPGEHQEVFIDGSITVDLNKQIAMIKPLSLQTSEMEINIEMGIKNLLDKPSAGGTFAVSRFSPRALAESLAIVLPETRSKDVLNEASMGFYFVVDEKNLEVSQFKFKLDKSTFLTQLKIENLAEPKVIYSIKLDQIVVDDYLPPVVQPVNSSVQKPVVEKSMVSTKTDTPIDLPVELLRSLNIDGVFQAATLIVSEQFVSDLKIKTTAKSGVIKLSELSANVLKGRVVSSAQLDVRKTIPQYQFQLQGKKLKAESIVNPILQDMLGEKSVSMSGETNLNANIKTRGESVDKLIAASNGTFSLNMGKAALHGVDAEYFVRKGVISYLEEKKQPVPQVWRGEYKPKDTTALKVARASATIRNGVIENKDLLLEASRFKITGAGNINLPQENFDYRVVVDVQPSKTKTAGEKLLDVPMPVFVRGSFAQPAISIDSKVWLKNVGKELKAEVKAEIKQKLKKEKKKKIDKLKNKYKDKFKGLFK